MQLCIDSGKIFTIVLEINGQSEFVKLQMDK